jgi:hypothetical protein
MPVIIAYMVLEAGSKKELEAEVREAIGKGWQPEGGISVANGRFYQAMVGH